MEEKAPSKADLEVGGGGPGGLDASGGGDVAADNRFSVWSFAASVSRSTPRSATKARTAVRIFVVSSVSSV
jgi:hypothetical protein